MAIELRKSYRFALRSSVFITIALSVGVFVFLYYEQ